MLQIAELTPSYHFVPLILKNIVFDLGGVIIDLDVERTIHAFAKLAGKSISEIQQAYTQHPEFLMYEKGELTDDQFRTALRKILNIHAADHDIDLCWNAMLVDLPKPKLDLLESLKQEYTVTVLSNTNNIHLEYINNCMLHGNQFQSLDSFFHHCYYSHQVGKRKPEPEIYRQLLDETSFNPKQTLFLDDRLENLEAAAAFGIQTRQVEYPNQVFELLKNKNE